MLNPSLQVPDVRWVWVPDVRSGCVPDVRSGCVPDVMLSLVNRHNIMSISKFGLPIEAI